MHCVGILCRRPTSPLGPGSALNPCLVLALSSFLGWSTLCPHPLGPDAVSVHASVPPSRQPVEHHCEPQLQPRVWRPFISPRG